MRRQSPKKVGLFGGSFDPIHLGHLTLAISLLEVHHLDEVIFSPAFCSPFKTQTPPQVFAQHRLEMVRLAICEVPQFSLWEKECLTPQRSFTIDTVREILKERQEIELHLLFSEETLCRFPEWKDYEELEKLAPPLVGVFSSPLQNCPYPCTQIPYLEISSTAIRKRLSQGLYCGHLLKSSVFQYIQTQGLYR